MNIFKKTQPDNPAPANLVARSGKTRRKAVDKRNKSLKTISITSTLIFLVILLIVNVAFSELLGGSLKWDWTSNKLYSIGDVSKQILAGMDKDVEIIGLFNSLTDSTYTDIQEMLKNYARLSNGRIAVRYVDPVKFPSILTEIDPTGYLKPGDNTFVVYCKATSKAKVIAEGDIFAFDYDQTTYQKYLTGVTAEQSFTGAIKYVLSETTPVVYFTAGHNEADYTKSFTLLSTILKNNNYDVKTLDTFGLDKIPDDCATLIMVDPQNDISAGDSGIIGDYLKRGGGLMVLTSFSNAAFPVLNQLLVDYSIEISNNKIREADIDHRYGNDPYTIRAIAPKSAITPTAVDGYTLAENVRGINELQIKKEWIKVTQVLTTSAQGIAETNGDSTQSSAPTVQNIGLISENSGYVNSSTVTKTAKVMVMGSASVFSDTVLQASSQLYNAYLFYYGVQWLANASADSNLYIEAKVPTSYTITSGTESTRVLTAVFVMLVIPAALLLAALFVYRKRKHL
jgi:ABC-2 type transport system permease protein